MRYEVPQFIDVEDKIFGPLTFKQAIYLAGSAGLAFAFSQIVLTNLPFELNMLIKMILSSPFVAIGMAFAFMKVNKRPFVAYVESIFYYLINSKRYVWRKKDKTAEKRQKVSARETESIVGVPKNLVPNMNRSKLKEIAWSLDMDRESI